MEGVHNIMLLKDLSKFRNDDSNDVHNTSDIKLKFYVVVSQYSTFVHAVKIHVRSRPKE